MSVDVSNRHGKAYMGDFDSRARAYETRIYRTALILTKNSQDALELTERTFRKAKKQFNQRNSASDLGRILSQTVLEEFLNYK